MYIKKCLFKKYSTKIESKGWYYTIMVADIPNFCGNLCWIYVTLGSISS